MDVTDKAQHTEEPKHGQLASSIKSLGIVNLLPAGQGRIQYLDFVLEETTEMIVEEVSSGPMNSWLGNGFVKSLSMKMFIQEIVPIDSIIMVAPDDPTLDFKLTNEILLPALNLINKIADDNDPAIKSKYPTGIDLNIKQDHDGQRKVLSRMLAASNILASEVSRRGPATFAIMSRKLFDFMTKDFYFQETLIYKAESVINIIHGLDILISDMFEDQIILGRTGKEEPGVYVHAEDPGLNDFLSENGSIEPSAVNLRYSVVSVGKRLPYVKLKVKFTDEQPITNQPDESILSS